MVDVVVNTLADPRKKKKDDVHVVITDGCFDYSDVEQRIKQAVKHETKRDDVADKAPKHTFWMIYDADDHLQNSWKSEIKEGTLIFINSESVKNNK